MRMFDAKLDGSSVDAMIEAIRNLPAQKPPSAGRYDGLLDGLDCIKGRVRALLAKEKDTAPV